ncbi:MAG: hypothetical protein ACI4S4_07690 [Candidatus Ornithospirochaeta sp.]
MEMLVSSSSTFCRGHLVYLAFLVTFINLGSAIKSLIEFRYNGSPW